MKMQPRNEVEASWSRAGRPRNPHVQRRIFDAAKKLIIERGYAGLSIEGIAAQSGVAKTSIYRRWSSLFDLAAALLDEANRAWPVVPPATGQIAEDLGIVYRNWVAGISGPGRVIAVLIAGSVQDRELANLLHEKFVHPRLVQVIGIIDDAVARGELPEGADSSTAIDMFLGRMWYRVLVTGEEIRLEDEKKVVHLLMEGLRKEPISPSRLNRPSAHP